MGLAHSVASDFQPYLFGLDCGADGVAEVDLRVLLFRVGEDGTELPCPFDLHQLLHVLHVLLVRTGIPKEHTELNPVRLLVRKHQRPIAQVAPLVVGPNSRTVHV